MSLRWRITWPASESDLPFLVARGRARLACGLVHGSVAMGSEASVSGVPSSRVSVHHSSSSTGLDRQQESAGRVTSGLQC